MTPEPHPPAAPAPLTPAEREEIRQQHRRVQTTKNDEKWVTGMALIGNQTVPRLLDALDAADTEIARLRSTVTELRGVLWTIDRAPRQAQTLARQGMQIADAALSPPQR